MASQIHLKPTDTRSPAFSQLFTAKHSQEVKNKIGAAKTQRQKKNTNK